jgi:uncharacterized membrane protein YeiH
MVLYLMTLLGVDFFAVSGALRAREKEMDFFGVLVIAAITAAGGGTIRDVLLGTQPVFWIEDINFLLVSVAAATITMLSTPGYASHQATPCSSPMPSAWRLLPCSGLRQRRKQGRLP